METLLKKINFEESDYHFFDTAKLNKIVGNTSKDSYKFYITINELLPVSMYNKINEYAKKGFSDLKNIELIFSSNNIDYDIFKEYFIFFITELSKEYPMVSAFLDRTFTLDNNVLLVEVANKAEEMKLKSIAKKLEDKFKLIGAGTVEIKATINKEINKEVLEEMNKVEVEVKPVEKNPVIKGDIIKSKPMSISDVLYEEGNLTVEGEIFKTEGKEFPKTNLITFKITDGTDSIDCKVFERDADKYKSMLKELKEGNSVMVHGMAKNDSFSKELVFFPDSIMSIVRVKEERKDTSERKRVELHTHTMMSQMDGLVDAKKLVKQAYKWGHKAIAITDHNCVQAFPDVYHLVCDLNKGKEESDKFKAIYGTELTLIDDSVNIVVRENDSVLLDNTYVVFDFETTGFNAGGGDTIIEIGAVKLHNGEIIDRYDELINPGHPLPKKITEVTSITDDMLKDKDNEENAIKRFIEWFKDYPMVAHNAKFDVSFLEMCYQKYNLGEYKNTVIDTLELSRILDNNYARHSLSALVKRYDVPWDEESHHRGDYDAEGTALVFHKMMKKLSNQNIDLVSDLNKMIDKNEIHKYGRSFHVNILAKNKVGLKNLFKIVSLANTTYLYKTPRILRSEISRLREGLLIGSGCYESEVFVQARSKSEEELSNIINFYDYVEVQPVDVYKHLLQSGDFASEGEIIENIQKIIRTTISSGKIIVASGDAHHLNPEDKIYREIIVNQKVPGGGRHPLARNGITDIPNQYFRTTDEMLENFSFLDEETRNLIVIDNPNKIADMVDIIEVIIETGGVPFSPRVKGDDGNYLDCAKEVTSLVYNKVSDWYGDPLPYNIEERIAKELYGDAVYKYSLDNLKEEHPEYNSDELNKEVFKRVHDVIVSGFDSVKELMKKNIKKNWTEEDGELTDLSLEKKMKKELGGIIGGGFDPIYLIAQRLVKHSNDDGYLVGSRGSVGSSLVATMMGITEVNALPAHYRCPNCKKSIFKDENGEDLSNTYLSGFDLPDKNCPNCNIKMIKDGNDMPFATFLGFNADKVPDIDLNFSDLNQASAHDYTKVLFGVDNVYRAGTIGTVADKTAYGYVKGYCEEKGITKRSAEIERLAMGCTGVKRTTGQHPGGIVVVPDYMDVFDFTPFQFPADDPTSAWRTTHFDYHAIDQDLLKLDILGHSDPTQLRIIQELSGHDITKVPLDDKETMGIFLSPKPLGVTKEQIMCDTGTLGIPEFGTGFTIGLVAETKPTTFAELIKIAGLSHGTDVWLGNAQDLIRNNIVEFKDTIGCRDDIMVYLMQKGMKPIKAFKIMEFVRKGKASKDPDTWAGYEKDMREAGIEEWYITSCKKIKYMFPKAHATAYVMSAFRIAYYKVHYPIYFYASWFSTKATDFDIETMIKGHEQIKNRIVEIINKGYDATNKEQGILECLKIALEMTARGLKFENVSLTKSEATTFAIDIEKNTLIPPFSSIDGLGDTVAKTIVQEREKGMFLSIEDLQKRGKVSKTLIEKMKEMHMLDGMDETSQLSLF